MSGEYKWPEQAPFCAREIDAGPQYIFDNVAEEDRLERLRQCIQTLAAGRFAEKWAIDEAAKSIWGWWQAGKLDYPLTYDEVLEIVRETSRLRVDCREFKVCPEDYCDPDNCSCPANAVCGPLFDAGEVPEIRLVTHTVSLEPLSLLKVKGQKARIDTITGAVVKENGRPVMDPDYTLSPTKAAAAVVGNMDLCLDATDRANEPTIWRYEAGIWSPTGQRAIINAVDEAVGDLSHEKGLRETLRRVRARVDPVTFNADPTLMPLLNGAVDLRTGKFRGLTPADYLTFRYNATYDPEADYRHFLWFLCTTQADPRDVLTLIDLYAAVFQRVSFEVFALLFGGGSNGKGIFEKVLLHIVTQERRTALKFDEMARSRFGPGALLDKEVWVVSEVSSAKDVTSALKRVSSGELIDTDVKYGGRRQGLPHLLPILDANEIFDFADDTKGRKRRMVKLDFPYSFDYGADDRPKDPHLLEKLTQPDALSGIVRLIVARGPSLFKTRRIYRRRSEEESEDIMKRQQHSLSYFCEECLTSDPPDVQGDRLTIEAAYAEYLEYCLLFHIPTPAKRVPFGRYLGERFGVKSISTTIGDQRFRYYPGLWISKKAMTVYAEHCLNYNNYISTTNESQIVESEISISEWIATHTTDETLQEVLYEIFRMYKYIKSCKSAKDISWEKYIDSCVVAVASVVDGCSIAVSSTTDQNTSVVDHYGSEVNPPDNSPFPPSDLRMIRVLDRVPQFMGVDGRRYGPYLPEDVVALPNIHAAILVKRGAAAAISPIDTNGGEESIPPLEVLE